MFQQILREWPPGYGGVERVAHELATTWGESVFTLDAQSRSTSEEDPLPVVYPRIILPCFPSFGRLRIPLPSPRLFSLLTSQTPLLGHLPSPGILLILLLARLISPSRTVVVFWHCFLADKSGIGGSFYNLYQKFALLLIPYMSAVVTTSPILADVLIGYGCSPSRVFQIPCCLGQDHERLLLSVQDPVLSVGHPLRLIYIGRLDSYKRVDWLMHALSEIPDPCVLTIVGDGPKRPALEALNQVLFKDQPRVRFLGRLSEDLKFKELVNADLLCLPSECSNEAFGIVQLEAMAAGVPSLAFDIPCSGMGWVASIPTLVWSQSPSGLPYVLRRLSSDRHLLLLASIQSRVRYTSVFARSLWLKQLALLEEWATGVKVTS